MTKKNITISFPQKLWVKFFYYCEAKSINKSKLIQGLVIKEMEKETRKELEK
jgi:hypothetical protein